MRIRTALVVLALPLALATACGSDDDTASDPTSTTATSPSASATPTDAASPSPADPSVTDATTDPTTSASPTAPSTPDPSYPPCADVWQKGATLKAAYQGCNDGDTAVKADVLSCSSGQALVRYDDRFWAVRGGRIAKAASLEQDKDYLDSVASCRA